MKVFLSYRRSDSGNHVDRIEKTLRARLAGVEIFRDIGSIDSGERWLDEINAAIAGCDMMLVIIGPTWLTVEKDGVRRLDDPSDVVRMEIASGLEQRTLLIPVLVDGGSFPPHDALPPNIQALVWINAHVIGKRTMKKDLTALLQRMGSVLQVRVQEEASGQGRAEADRLIQKVEQLMERDPEAEDFEAYWRWFLEAKDVLRAASTGTEVTQELHRLEMLFMDARSGDDVGRELTMLEAGQTIKHIRQLFSTEEERASDSARTKSVEGGPIVMAGVSSFDPVGAWEFEMSDSAGTSAPVGFQTNDKGLVTGSWLLAGEQRRVDGVWRLRMWQPPEDGRRWVGGRPTRVNGLVLDIKIQGMPQLVLDIPVDEEFGSGYRGRDSEGKTFILRKIA